MSVLLHPAILAIMVYGAVFVYLCWQSKHYLWLAMSVVVGLILGAISSFLMPNVLGIFRLPNAFLLHTYFFLSLPAFYYTKHKMQPEIMQPEIMQPEHFRQPEKLLSLFAQSLMGLHLAFLLFACLIYAAYPSGLSAWASAFLIQFYVSEPLTLYALQVLLMLLFFLDNTLNTRPKNTLFFIELGVFLMLIWQVAYVVARLMMFQAV